MTWRERIAAARERGHFTDDDKAHIDDFQTCMVGETCRPLTDMLGQPAWWVYPDLRAMGEDGPVYAVLYDKFDAAERCLDAIEGRVLQLKREHAAQKKEN